MKSSNSPTAGLSRRKFIKNSAGAGAALASSLAAPALLAQTRAPIKIGNLNSYTGAIAYAVRGQPQCDEPLLRQHQLDGRRPQDRDHQGGRPVQSAGRLAEGQEAGRERQGRSDRRRAGQQRRARRAQLHEAAEGVLRGVRRRHRRHHLGPLSRICSAPRSRPTSSARRWRSMSTTISARRSSPPPPTMPAAATSSPSSRGRTSPRAARCIKEIWPPLGTTDFSAYLTDIKSINPPVTYDFMPGADAVRFIQQYSEFGLKEKMPLTGFTIIDSQMLKTLGKACARRDLRADLCRHRRQSGEQEIRRRLSGEIQGGARPVRGLRLRRRAARSARR